MNEVLLGSIVFFGGDPDAVDLVVGKVFESERKDNNFHLGSKLDRLLVIAAVVLEGHCGDGCALRFNEWRLLLFPQKTNEEQQVALYSPEERTKFQQETKKTLRNWVRCKSEKELYEKHNETIRGLESFLDKELWVKLMREQKDAIAGILLLQNHWRHNALPSNSEEMASVCALFCGPAKDRAYLQGAIDAVASRTALPRSLRNNRSALA